MTISEGEFRSCFVRFLIQEKGYPKGLVMTELPLPLFHEGAYGKRDRRVDILVSALHAGVPLPLLLIECKKRVPDRRAYNQLFGYNTKMQAKWCALIWPTSYVLFREGVLVEKGTIDDFPRYERLMT